MTSTGIWSELHFIQNVSYWKARYPVYIHLSFKKAYCLHFQGWKINHTCNQHRSSDNWLLNWLLGAEDDGNWFVRNVCELTTTHPKRQLSSKLPLSQPIMQCVHYYFRILTTNFITINFGTSGAYKISWKTINSFSNYYYMRERHRKEILGEDNRHIVASSLCETVKNVGQNLSPRAKT
jgi:hypothetical protein